MHTCKHIKYCENMCVCVYLHVLAYIHTCGCILKTPKDKFNTIFCIDSCSHVHTLFHSLTHSLFHTHSLTTSFPHSPPTHSPTMSGCTCAHTHKQPYNLNVLNPSCSGNSEADPALSSVSASAFYLSTEP